MPILPAIDAAARGLDRHRLALLHDEACHFAILDDVDAVPVGGAGIAPGHRVVAHGAGAALQNAAPDGPARFPGIIEIGQKLHHLAAVEQFGVDAVEPHDVAAPREGIELHRVDGQHDLAALRHHAVEIQLVREAFPELQRMLEELGVAVDHVIGADERGVAPDIAGADIAALQHRDIADAVVLRQIIGGRQAMAAAADDHRIIGFLRLGRAPGPRPGQIGRQRVTGKGEG